MVDLVYWSFVMALTPVALGLAWRLISDVGDRIGLGRSRAFEDAEPRGSLPLLNFHQPSGCISVAGRTSCPGTARSWAPNRRGPS
jgi:hypothetical protein